MNFKAKLRKIGNSIGVIIPLKVITGYSLGEVITLEVITKTEEVITKEPDVITEPKEPFVRKSYSMAFCTKHKGSVKATCGCL